MENTGTELNRTVLANTRQAPRWLERNARLLMTASMLASDLLGLFAAGFLAVVSHNILLGQVRSDTLVWSVPLITIMVVLFTTRHLYPGIGLGAVEEFRDLTIGISLTFIISSVLLLVLKEGASISRYVFVILWVVSLVTIPAFRRLMRHGMTRLALWGEPMAIIGPAEPALQLYEQLKKDPKIGLKPVAVLTPKGEGRQVAKEAPLFPLEKLDVVCGQWQLGMAAVLYDQLDEMEGIINRYRERFERLVLFHTNGNHLYLNKVSIQHYGSLISLGVHHRLLDPWAQAFKRIVDILISGILLILLLPFYLILACLIFLDSPGPILYRQVRLGKRGRLYTLYKLRTMYVNADQVLETTLDGHAEYKQEWDRYQKLKHDPRVTRLGRFLRRFSIDELAQLWNVLKGEMSLVGPRPIVPSQRYLYGDYYQHYERVRPGISGLWQINGRNHISFDRRAELDTEYVISWSVWLDIYIIVRTVWVVFNRKGAY